MRGLCVAVWLAVSCATANDSAIDASRAVDSAQPHDARRDAPAHDDAAIKKDAAPIADAAPPPADAAGSGGEPCLVNSNCTDPNTCCYFFVCTQGAGVGSNLCFPSS